MGGQNAWIIDRQQIAYCYINQPGDGKYALSSKKHQLIANGW
jgi:hypothetical protein